MTGGWGRDSLPAHKSLPLEGKVPPKGADEVEKFPKVRSTKLFLPINTSSVKNQRFLTASPQGEACGGGRGMACSYYAANVFVGRGLAPAARVIPTKR